jgi:hypothetical protein
LIRVKTMDDELDKVAFGLKLGICSDSVEFEWNSNVCTSLQKNDVQVWILNTGGKAETRRRKKNGKILLHGNDGESAELKRVKRMDGGRRMGCVRTYIWNFMYGPRCRRRLCR